MGRRPAVGPLVAARARRGVDRRGRVGFQHLVTRRRRLPRPPAGDAARRSVRWVRRWAASRRSCRRAGAWARSLGRRRAHAGDLPLLRPAAREFVPYIRAAAATAAQSGLPIIRPLHLVEPAAGHGGTVADAYGFGPALWVAPVLDEGARLREVVVPHGDWIETLSGVPGGREVVAPAPRSTIPGLGAQRPQRREVPRRTRRGGLGTRRARAPARRELPRRRRVTTASHPRGRQTAQSAHATHRTH